MSAPTTKSVIVSSPEFLDEHERVLAGSAREVVVPRAAGDGVVVRPTRDRIGPGITHEHIVAIAAVDGVDVAPASEVSEEEEDHLFGGTPPGRKPKTLFPQSEFTPHRRGFGLRPHLADSPSRGDRGVAFTSRKGCPLYSLKRGLFQQPRRPRVCRVKNERLTRPERRAARGQTLPSRSGLSPHSDFPSPEDPTVSPEPIRRTNGRVSSAHPRDWITLPSPGRADPHAWPQFLGLPSELTPARRIRPAASAPKREAARRPPPDSPVASTNTRRGSTNGSNGIRGGGV